MRTFVSTIWETLEESMDYIEQEELRMITQQGEPLTDSDRDFIEQAYQLN